MTVKLVFLGRLEELAGSSSLALDLQDRTGSQETDQLGWPELLECLTVMCGVGLTEMVSSVRVKIAVNGALIADKEGLLVKNGDELAFLPPVSGG